MKKKTVKNFQSAKEVKVVEVEDAEMDEVAKAKKTRHGFKVGKNGATRLAAKEENRQLG